MFIDLEKDTLFAMPRLARMTYLRIILHHPLMLHLYLNKEPPDDDDDLCDYVELSGHGYKPVPLWSNGWRINNEDPPMAEHDNCRWESTGGEPAYVYGYSMTLKDNGQL